MAAAPLATYFKAPNEVLDYSLDWSGWLKGDFITNSSWATPAGLGEVLDLFGASLATVWLSGGVEGVSYDVVNHITTAGGRQAERTIRITVVLR